MRRARRPNLIRAVVAAAAAFATPSLAVEPAVVVAPPPTPPAADRALTLVDSGNGFAEAAVWIAGEAGFVPDVVRMPGPRVVVEFRERPREMTCAGGWFRTPERETFARFTTAFRLDPPEGVVVSSRVAARARALGGFGALFADASIRFMAYPPEIRLGEVFDRLYARRGDVNSLRVQTEYSDRAVIARLLARSRIDAAPGFNLEQFNEMRSIAAEEGDDLSFLDFPDGPARNTRHIMCSRVVPEAVIAALDGAITRMVRTGLKF